MGRWNSTIAMNPELSSKFTLSVHKIVTVFVKTLSQQKHVVLQSTVPLQLIRLKICSKMAIAGSAPLLPNQKKKSVAKSPDSLTHPVYAKLLHSLSEGTLMPPVPWQVL
jgi:hypothetical protein